MQPLGHDKLSETLVLIFMSLEGEKELPEYPGRQTHLKPPRVLIQMPSCRQGESSHSFTSRSHSVPKYPWGQIQRNLGRCENIRSDGGDGMEQHGQSYKIYLFEKS